MKPVSDCKCNLGHSRPEECRDTLFGLNVERRNGEVIIHGNLKKVGA